MRILFANAPPRFGMNPHQPDYLPKAIQERLQLNGGQPLVPEHRQRTQSWGDDCIDFSSDTSPGINEEGWPEAVDEFFADVMRFQIHLEAEYAKVLGDDAARFVKLTDITTVYEQNTGKSIEHPAIDRFAQRFEALLDDDRQMSAEEKQQLYSQMEWAVIEAVGGRPAYRQLAAEADQYRAELDEHREY